MRIRFFITISPLIVGFIGMALSYGLSLNMSLVFSIQNQCTLPNYVICIQRLNQYMHIPSEAPEVIEGNLKVMINSWFEGVRGFYKGITPNLLKNVTVRMEPASIKLAICGFAIGRHCFYVYYDGEQYFHDLHGLSYRGKSVKQKFIESKCGTHLRKMHWKIMEALGLDRGSHKISIVYHAPKILVITQVLYNSNSLGCDADMDMMWTVIKQTPKFIASDLYVTVEAVGFHVGTSS
ncbi:abc transporter c family member 10 [Quercus suber]|uniref:Abc transporter c family member 10 n=1 Tax=Quercus suber TaxID=58331 RepID=A0AAW0LKJ9_QUESU